MLNSVSHMPACHAPPSNTSCVKATTSNVYPVHEMPQESISSPIMQFQRNGEVEDYTNSNQMRNSSASQIMPHKVHAATVENYSPPMHHSNLQHIQPFSTSYVNILHSQLNPMVSCFVPQNINIPVCTQATSSLPNGVSPTNIIKAPDTSLPSWTPQIIQHLPGGTSFSDSEGVYDEEKSVPIVSSPEEQSEPKEHSLINLETSATGQHNSANLKVMPAMATDDTQEPCVVTEDTAKVNSCAVESNSAQKVASPVVSHTWANVLKNNNRSQPSTTPCPAAAITEKVDKSLNKSTSEQESETCTTSIEEDKMSFALGSILSGKFKLHTSVLNLLHSATIAHFHLNSELNYCHLQSLK